MLAPQQRRGARGWLYLPGHGVRWIRDRWVSSLQFRTVSTTVFFTFASALILGLFLSHQVSTGLFESRFAQVQAEANHGLNQARTIFENANTNDQENTSNLVTDTLGSLAGGSGTMARGFILVPLDEGQNLYVGSISSAGVSEDLITQEMSDAVAEDQGIYWQSVSVPVGVGEQTGPGLVFGTQLVLPPGNFYALYLVYDLTEVQSTLDYLTNVLVLALVILLVLNIMIALFTTRQVVRPVQQAAATAESLSSGDLSVRMAVRRRDEVARLGTSFNRMADNIQDQITQLADLSMIQQRFVSDVSHELRTPLTTVSMAAEVLHDSRYDFDPVNRRSAELLYHQVERFQALLADLLEISRFDAGAAEVAAESTDILHLAADVVLTAQPLADNADTEVWVVPVGENFTADVDHRRIERILRNLVNNAIEHGESRPVDVIVASDEVQVAVVVRDHGIGMNEEQVAHVFDRFWRADPARTRTTGGSGLGLSIAAEDTRLHHGQLDVWGEPGEGAAFRLVLPRNRGEATTATPPLCLPPDYDLADRRPAREIEFPQDDNAEAHDNTASHSHADLPKRAYEQSLHPPKPPRNENGGER
ncbi:MtrAB system histidine kinase MtrB [Citricoccus muralis]|uniref:Sensor histidine kinase MtrB n=1 Tax=Citricoccus muralis TaxID=169134 RepID=A0ABY8H3E6_9MICC|nr:MtrAB system histidine kinase MtrB [Citricoccus muralis]WFP15639.1 MtrAB system histidine kinase MtrB [Citricoccus muralis]